MDKFLSKDSNLKKFLIGLLNKLGRLAKKRRLNRRRRQRQRTRPKSIRDIDLKGKIRKTGSNLDKAGDFFGWEGGYNTKGPSDFTRESLLANGWTEEALLEVADAYDDIARLQTNKTSGRLASSALREPGPGRALRLLLSRALSSRLAAGMILLHSSEHKSTSTL